MREHKAGQGMAIRLACALLALLFSALHIPAMAAESETVVRVGFINQNALSRLEENGTRQGYDYEYLQEVAQYTGWNYEFVDFENTSEDILRAMDMLEKGEIDLMTSLLYAEGLAQQYNYAAYSNGSVNTVLGVFDDNTTTNETNLFQYRSLRVAVNERAKTRISELEQFCAMSGIKLEQILCTGLEEQRAAVRGGEADVLLEIDINLPEDMRIVARFAPRPFYFVGAKAKSMMMNRLNAALLNINESDPYFSVGLYEKYFGNTDTVVHLSQEEQVFVRGAGAVRVAFFPGRMPIQDLDEKTGEFIGVTRDVFDYIAQVTGLTFEYVPVRVHDEVTELLTDGVVDLVAGMPYDYNTADEYNVVMSRPYMTAQTTYALGKGVDIGDLGGKRLAMFRGSTYDECSHGEVLVYESPQECLDAVERGEADFTVGNNYTMQYYTNLWRYRSMSLVPREGVTQKMSIGLGKPVNSTLLTILNKAIRSLPESDLQSIVYRNATTPTRVTLTSFVADNLWPVMSGILIFALVIIGLLVIYFRAHIRMTRRAALENERYRQLSELTNEHIFEYDYVKDCLSISERSAKELNAPRVRENYRFRLRQDNSPVAKEEMAFSERLVENKSGQEELRVTMSDGSRRWFRVAAKLISDAAGKPLLAVGRMTDIQAEREELERLAEKAQRDGLTGVYNGETTRQMVTHLLKEHTGGALLVMDIDEFKNINDRHGHFAGDQTLIALSQLLKDTFRRSDVVGRLGGDEFVVFIDQVTERTTVEGKCRQVVEGASSLDVPLNGEKLTVSVGAVLARGEKDYNRLYQLADKALYGVKEKGKNGYRLD